MPDYERLPSGLEILKYPDGLIEIRRFGSRVSGIFVTSKERAEFLAAISAIEKPIPSNTEAQ